MGFKPDYKGIGLFLKSPEMQAGMLRLANKIKVRAQATAPVQTGALKASIEASSGLREDRAYGRVTIGVDYALAVEFGTSDTPAHRVLGRALDAVNE